MQCPSCEFQNMPGSAVCGRCGAQLRLATAVLDVHPPRASPLAKRLRRWFPLYRLGYRLRDAMRASLPGLPSAELAQLDPGVLPRMLVPGWPQLYLGRRNPGRAMLYAYLALLALGLLFVGSSPGAMLLGTAWAVHAASVIDVVWQAAYDWRARLTTAGLILALVAGAVYLPVGWTVTRFVQVRRIEVTAGPLAAGDAVLYRPSAYRRRAPAVGDVVLYHIPAQNVTGRNTIYRIQGEFLDRIVAGPGQSIHWEKQLLQVDGQPSQWQPLHPAGIPVDLKFAVPTGYYCILPSIQPQAAPHFPAEVWQQISLVPRGSIRGTILLRNQPLWRWGRIR